MAEAFAKTLKRDDAHLADLPTARAALARLDGWFEDYNEHPPHKWLRMPAPKEFRRSRWT